MSSPPPIDPYEVLGVPRNAELSAIRSAHRKLAFKHHPDRIKDEAERKRGTEEFQKAQQAYELLSDEKRRARYDDQVRLAQLRKEAMMDRGIPSRPASYPVPQPSHPPRTYTSTTYDYTHGRTYEERRPRYSDEDDRYPEATRTSTKKPSSYERRPATSQGEEKKKKHSEKLFSGFTSTMESKLREKARQAKERSAHAEAAKARDRARRRDSFDKYARRTPYVEDDSSDDSDTIHVSKRPEPARRKTQYEEPSRRRQETPRRRNSREEESSDSSSSDSDSYVKRDPWAHKHKDATNYISGTSGRPNVLRMDSAQYILPREKSAGRKSGSDRDERREDRPRSSKSSRPIEVVEPPRRAPQSRKPPSPMTSAKSSPSVLKSMTREAPQRSTTAEYPTDSRRPMASMSRSNTMPIPTASRKDAAPSKGSKLKHAETQDSGYGSSGPTTPENYGSSPPKSAKTTSSKFFIVEENAEHSRGYRAVPAGDTYTSRRTRSPSPAPRERERDREERRDKDKERKRPERPTVQTNTSYASSRGPPYVASPEHVSGRPNMFRSETTRSSRDAPPLARGDSSRRTHADSPKDDGFRIKPDGVRYSPHLNHESISRHTRRGSSDVRDRDYAPGSSHFDNIHGPKVGRRESIY